MAKRKAYQLEVCVDSVESAKAAEAGGADRLELCDNLVIGGTTPSPVFYEQVRKSVNIPIHVLIRPRFGDFLYSEAEVERMEQEIAALYHLGANSFVIGALQADGTLDVEALKRLMQAALQAQFILHRAFDMTKDLLFSLEQAVELGFSGILTSGGENTAIEGATMLRRLKEKGRNRLDIIAGAGIRSSNLKNLLDKTGIGVYHLSGKKRIDSRMRYRREKIFMGLEGISEYESFVTEEEEIRRVADILKKAEREKECQHFG